MSQSSGLFSFWKMHDFILVAASRSITLITLKDHKLTCDYVNFSANNGCAYL
jgi:hypothetical protein